MNDCTVGPHARLWPRWQCPFCQEIEVLYDPDWSHPSIWYGLESGILGGAFALLVMQVSLIPGVVVAVAAMAGVIAAGRAWPGSYHCIHCGNRMREKPTTACVLGPEDVVPHDQLRKWQE